MLHPPTYRAFILTALPVERRAVRARLSELREETHPEGTLYERGCFVSAGRTWEVLLVEAGMGNARAAFETERALQYFRPQVALLVGVAGGLKDVALGDVVISSKVYGYESGKARREFEPRPDVGEGSYPLEQRARHQANEETWLSRLPELPARKPRALVGAIAAGEKVVAEVRSDVHQLLRTGYGDALAVDMEGRGFLMAARGNRGVDALVIRGISDLIEGKAEADAAGSQEVAARNASAFAFELLAGFDPPLQARAAQPILQGGERELLWVVPYPRNQGFTGRSKVLRDIREHFLSETSSPKPLALFGLGGVGKTQLAVEYAHRHAHEASHYSHVLWLRADTSSVLASSYAALAEKLGLPESAETEQSGKVAAVRQWLGRNERWLLVLDNAEESEHLRPYLPPVLRGHVLITSRNSAWGRVATALCVDVWERAESVTFLRECTRQDDEAAASSLAEALGDLPLALTQAATYIDQTGKSLSEYLGLFEQRRNALLARSGPPSDYPHSVTATWELSFEQAKTRSPAGAALLALCSFLDSSPIPLDLIIHGAEVFPEPLARVASDELDLDEALRVLRRYSLVQVHERTLLFHRLVQGVMRERLTPEERELWAGAALRLILKFFTFHPYDLRTWRRCTLLLLHALEVWTRVIEVDAGLEPLPGLLWNLGNYWIEQAEYEFAKDALEMGLGIVEQFQDADPLAEASLHQSLGRCAMAIGEWAEVEKHLMHAQRLFQSMPQEQMRHTVILADLAALGVKSQRWEAALTYAEQALEIGNAFLEDGDPMLGILLSLKGAALQGQGVHEQARVCLERALEISEASFRPPNPRIAQDLNNLAKSMEELGRYEESKAFYERALEMTESIYGPRHPHVATVLGNLGDCHWLLGNRERSRECYERALRIEEDVFGPNHVELAPILNKLASILMEQDEFPTARVQMERVIALKEKRFGAEHPDLTVALTKLAKLYFKSGEIPRARLLIERALTIKEKSHAPRQPEVVEDLLNLALLLTLEGETERAQTLLQRALSIHDAQGPLLSSEFLVTLLQMGSVLYERQEWAAARICLESALRISEHVTPLDASVLHQLKTDLGVVRAHLEKPDGGGHETE